MDLDDKKVLYIRLGFATVLAIIGFIVAGPIISYFVKNAPAHVMSGKIASGLILRLWTALAFFILPWLIILINYWLRNRRSGFSWLAIISIPLTGAIYTLCRIFFAIQFYSLFQIEGVYHYINLRYFNLGRHLIFGFIAGGILTLVLALLSGKRGKRNY